MDDPTSQNSRGGCFSKLAFLFLITAIAGFTVVLYHVAQPQDLSDLERVDPGAPVGRDLNVVLKNAIDRGYPVTLSEAEINQWLARTLVTKQGGLFEDKITLDRVWIRLTEGGAEVVMQRSFWGRPFTTSMYVQIERMEGPDGVGTEVRLHGDPFHDDWPRPPRGGRLGQLVVPQGFLLLVMPSYQKLAAVFPREIKLAFQEMARVEIQKGKLVLDPREPLGDPAAPLAF